jgi:SP family general alpha glucoside:H+ symporter-like MFS transporter
LFWAGACAVLFTWSYFCLPEPKGRTYGELDALFERNISARKFASTVVDHLSEDKPELVTMTPTSSAETGKQIHARHEERTE